MEEKQLSLFTYNLAFVETSDGIWLVLVFHDFEGNIVSEHFLERVG